ncbi:MAG: PilZ domain-containing protein [Nitrospira sp.]|nr:PilZ domain-containing protein [Nitrospira sp.]
MNMDIDRRHAGRNLCNLSAKISSQNITYDGLIENVTEDGLEYLMTSFIEVSTDFTPEKILDMKFTMPDGEELNLNCEVQWYMKTSPEEKKLMLGMKIIEPPETYRALVRALQADSSD